MCGRVVSLFFAVCFSEWTLTLIQLSQSPQDHDADSFTTAVGWIFSFEKLQGVVYVAVSCFLFYFTCQSSSCFSFSSFHLFLRLFIRFLLPSYLVLILFSCIAYCMVLVAAGESTIVVYP